MDNTAAPAPPGRMIGLSKKISWLLRHGAIKSGIEMRPDGSVKVSDLLSLKQFRGYSFENIVHCVEQDNKQRYAMYSEEEVAYIRAQQGHSIPNIDPDLLLSRILDPADCPLCVHGTYRRCLDDILKTGLKTMGRNHIHFFSVNSTAAFRARSSCDVLIYVDAENAIKDGIPFYRSGNGVILSAGFNGILPPQYFLKVEKKPIHVKSRA